MTSSQRHYNPDWLDDDTLVANFVARIEDFAFLRDELARAPLQGTVQHHLLVGVRGSGKTTLLKRLAVAIRRDDDLKDHLIALSFPEELYQVKNLADFWWAACDALVDELDRSKRVDLATRLAAQVDAAQGSRIEAGPLSGEGFEVLQQVCAELGRRAVLLVDNLDMVFQRIDKSGRKLKNVQSPAYWALREALSTATSPIVIGGSVRLSEPFTSYDTAFYDFFMPKRLSKLSLADVRQVLERLADAQSAPEVRDRLRERPSRIEALYELTGGNPRALGFLFDLLRQGADSRAVEDFERLMDFTTPYYKARFEDSSEQAQVVMHALAVRRSAQDGLRFGHTAAEIGAHAGLATGTVSAQLDVLEREGLVEKSAAHGRTQYRIAEQLFRLWLQMRGNRRIRQNVIGLTEFLEAMFDLDELQERLKREGGASALADARFAFAVADTDCAGGLRRGFEAVGAGRLLRHLEENGGEVEVYLVAGDLPEDLAGVVGLRRQLQRCRCEWSAEEEDALIGSIELRFDEKEAGVRGLCDASTAEITAGELRARLAGERRRLLGRGLHEADLRLLYNLRAQGLLPLPGLTPHDAEQACVSPKSGPDCRAMIWRLVGAGNAVRFDSKEAAHAWLDWGQEHAPRATSTEWAHVAGAMRLSKHFVVANEALDRAFALGPSSRAWCERGTLLVNSDGDLLEAAAAYRRAIEQDPADPRPWNNLGTLFDTKLTRSNEAETAYRKAIELDQTTALPWNNLGALLARNPQQVDKAEAAFRKAIELDPTVAYYCCNLGILLASKLQRFDEAEAAYRKAIDKDPTDAEPWNNLGNLLANKLDRVNEGEKAYRKAIELDETLALPWLNLGWLFAHEDRLEEAVAAFTRGTELQPNLDPSWQAQRATAIGRLCATAAQQALNAGNDNALRAALARPLSESADATPLLTPAFIEQFLAPLLANHQQATTMLAAMRDAGYDRTVRPLLLAFEAATTNKPELLAELEPEVQGAARHMFERLASAKTSGTPR